MMNVQRYLSYSFAYFLLIGLLGTAMRWAYVVSPFFEYRFILHTHSHIALLGWVYLSITTLLTHQFITPTARKKYQKIFWATQITLIGMLFSFPFQGYALFSIIFSTLFLLVSYYFSYYFIQNKEKKSESYRWIVLSLFFMVLSSIGPWALGYIMTQFGRESALYKGAIYFYLHFQYNGWMLTALIGLFIKYLEQNKKSFDTSSLSRLRWLFGAGIALTLPLSWAGLLGNPLWILILGGVGVVLQIMSLGTLFIRNLYSKIFPKPYRYLFQWVKVLFLMKLAMQLISCIPWVSRYTFFNIDLVIGYLHFTFLGVISLSLLVLFLSYHYLQIPKWAVAFYLFVFLLTESIIFYKGGATLFGWILSEHYFLLLAIASTLFLLPITIFFKSSLCNGISSVKIS